MCRLVAYLGPPVASAGLLTDDPHALVRQARLPRLQRLGRNNPDGWGVGWYEPGSDEPRLVRSVRPIWEDDTLSRLAAETTSGAFLASVRAATPGLPVNEEGTAPYRSGHYLFAHNGEVEGFLSGAGERLRAMLTAGRRREIRGATDSEVLFALALDQLDAGASLREALAHTVAIARGVSGGFWNFVLTDGRALAATRAGNSLFWRQDGDAVAIASEPTDGGSWREAPEDSAISASDGRVEIVSLKEPFVEQDSFCSRPATSVVGGPDA